MGNDISVPIVDPLKFVPVMLSDNEYLEIKVNNRVYRIENTTFERNIFKSFLSKIDSKNFKKAGKYTVFVGNNSISTNIDKENLKEFVKEFASERGIDLIIAILEVKIKPKTNFGKKRTVKRNVKRTVKKPKSLMSDISYLK